MRYNKETGDNLVAAQSWTRYDPLIAIPCFVEQFARLDLHLTFFVPGWVIEKYPAQIDLLLKNGHEIALHGYLQAARLAGAELCVFKTFAAPPA